MVLLNSSHLGHGLCIQYAVLVFSWKLSVLDMVQINKAKVDVTH